MSEELAASILLFYIIGLPISASISDDLMEINSIKGWLLAFSSWIGVFVCVIKGLLKNN